MIEDVACPFDLFDQWFAAAAAAESDANAMTLATVGADGRPSARIMLLKGVDPIEQDPRGFVFYTNLGSRKAGELTGDDRPAALCFHWKSLHRQVRVEGRVTPVTAAEADAYYASRPYVSRIGAWASFQSKPLATRAELEARVELFKGVYPDENAVPRPPNWSGFRVVPSSVEFWFEMPFRLHDRKLFTRDGAGWTTGRIYP